MKEKQIAILGTVGVPAYYGGFETLAENLVKYHNAASLKSLLVRLSGSDINAAHHLNSLTKVALQS